jgi:hypothetical protein
MKLSAPWVCSVAMVLVGIAIIMRYGITLDTVFVLLILLGCPVIVIWQSLRISKKTETEIRNAVKTDSDNNARTK